MRTASRSACGIGQRALLSEEPAELTRCADDCVRLPGARQRRHRSGADPAHLHSARRVHSLDELAIYVAPKDSSSRCTTPRNLSSTSGRWRPGSPARPPNGHVTSRLPSDLAAGRSTSERRDAALDRSQPDPERRSQTDLSVGGDPVRPDLGRQYLPDELRLSKPLPPFPMCIAFPGSEYYGGSAHPARSAVNVPIR